MAHIPLTLASGDMSSSSLQEQAMPRLEMSLFLNWKADTQSRGDANNTRDAHDRGDANNTRNAHDHGDAQIFALKTLFPD